MGSGEAVTPAPKKPPPDAQPSPPTPNRPPWREGRKVLVPAAGACSWAAWRTAAPRAFPHAATRGRSRFLKSVRAVFPVRHAPVVAGFFDGGPLTRTFAYCPLPFESQCVSPPVRSSASVAAPPSVNRPAPTATSSEPATWAAVGTGARASNVRPTTVWNVLVMIQSSCASRFTSADGPADRNGDFTGQCAGGAGIGSRLGRWLHVAPRMSRFLRRPRISSQEGDT